MIDCNRQLREWHCPQVANFSALCRELTGTTFGELSRHCTENLPGTGPPEETRESLAGEPSRSRVSGPGDASCRRQRHPARIAEFLR